MRICIWFSIRSFMDSVGFCWLSEQNMSRKNFHPLSHSCARTNNAYFSVPSNSHTHRRAHIWKSIYMCISLIVSRSPVLIFFYIFGTTVKSKYPSSTNVVKTFIFYDMQVKWEHVENRMQNDGVSALVFFSWRVDVANKLTENENENGLRSLK